MAAWLVKRARAGHREEADEAPQHREPQGPVTGRQAGRPGAALRGLGSGLEALAPGCLDPAIPACRHLGLPTACASLPPALPPGRPGRPPLTQQQGGPSHPQPPAPRRVEGTSQWRQPPRLPPPLPSQATQLPRQKLHQFLNTSFKVPQTRGRGQEQLQTKNFKGSRLGRGQEGTSGWGPHTGVWSQGFLGSPESEGGCWALCTPGIWRYEGGGGGLRCSRPEGGLGSWGTAGTAVTAHGQEGRGRHRLLPIQPSPPPTPGLRQW